MTRRVDASKWFGYTDVKRREARVLRAQGDSVTVIARTLGVPRSTVGDWVRGMAEQAAMIRYCAWCGDAFLSQRCDRRFCCDNHRDAARVRKSPTTPFERSVDRHVRVYLGLAGGAG